MRSIRTTILVTAAVAAAACARDTSNTDAQKALNTDLQLAGQARPGTRQDSISAIEQANGGRAPQATARTYTSTGTNPTYRAPHRTTTTTTTTRSTTSSSSGASVGASGGTVTQRTTTVKHTERDAAIGAAAGAIIGATTSRDKVKGGLIGAAAGGILGGVIGNNVDKQEKPANPPPQN